MYTVLVLEDDKNIREFIVINLQMAGYSVFEADCGEAALELFDKEHIDLALFDVGLPDKSGFEVLRELKEKNIDTAIIMLTAMAQQSDIIKGLKDGADDYITKPFSLDELFARIEALLRRTKLKTTLSSLKYREFELDEKRRELTKNGVKLELTHTEFEILLLFFKNIGRAFKREELFSLIWGLEQKDSLKLVDVNIRRLRLKIESDADNPSYIHTVWGYGYKWE